MQGKPNQKLTLGGEKELLRIHDEQLRSSRPGTLTLVDRIRVGEAAILSIRRRNSLSRKERGAKNPATSVQELAVLLHVAGSGSLKALDH